MTRNLKALGLALVAMFAMSAVAASGASAQETENKFHAEQDNTVITAHENTVQTFTAGTSKITCTNLEVNVTVPKTADHITTAPKYSGCLLHEGGTTLTAHVDFNSCAYTFGVNGDISDPEDPPHHLYSGSVSIGCITEGDKIEVRATFLGERQCLDIPAQTPSTPTVDYTNTGEGATRDVKLISTVKGVNTVKTGICGSGEVSADYTGEVTLTGEEAEKNHVGIWVT